MKPSRSQYVLAHGVKLAMTIGAVVFAASAAWSCGISESTAILILLTSAFGGILGLLFIWPLLYNLACKRNGAPFKEGDWVRILIGSHRNKVVRVYALVSGRNEVRVDLGEHVKWLCRDAFMNNQVCREHPRDEELPELCKSLRGQTGTQSGPVGRKLA